MQNRATLALCLSLPLALAGLQHKEKTSITVYVEAGSDAPGAISKAKAKEISDSAEDLRRQIEKRRDLALAVHPETADIVITILNRGIEIAQNRQTDYGGGHTQSQYQSRHIITYRIETGKSSHRAEYFAAGSLVTWTRVATGLSKHIERWARDHLEQLLGMRARR